MLKPKSMTYFIDENELPMMKLMILIYGFTERISITFLTKLMKATDMSNAYRIKKNITDLNAKWKLKPTPGEAEGVQISLKDSLKEQIQRLKIKGDLGEQEIVRVNMSEDGTNIGKRLKVVNFTYTILNEKENAMSEKGNYVLAIIKTKETYDNLKGICEEGRKESVRKLLTIQEQRNTTVNHAHSLILFQWIM